MKILILFIAIFYSLNIFSSEYFISCKKINYETYLYLDLNISSNNIISDLEIRDLESNFNTFVKLKRNYKKCDYAKICLLGKDRYNNYSLYLSKKSLVGLDGSKELILDVSPKDLNSILTNKYICNR